MMFARSVLAFAFCCTGALAQEAATFTALTACRVDENRVLVRATFEGGACLAVKPVTRGDIGEPRGTIVDFTIATESIAEMCTMQIASIPFEHVLDIPLPVVDLDVTVVDPQNNVLAQGLAFADDTAEFCALPPG